MLFPLPETNNPCFLCQTKPTDGSDLMKATLWKPFLIRPQPQPQPPAPSRVQNVPAEGRLGTATVIIPGSFACPPPSPDRELHGGAERLLLITIFLAQQHACWCNGWDHSYLNELLQTGILEPELIFGPSPKWVNRSYLISFVSEIAPHRWIFKKALRWAHHRKWKAYSLSNHNAQHNQSRDPFSAPQEVISSQYSKPQILPHQFYYHSLGLEKPTTWVLCILTKGSQSRHSTKA